jgi:hypothetical protein
MQQRVKQLVFGAGERPHRVRFGVGAGMRLLIDPASKTQRILGLDEAEIASAFRRAAAQVRTFVDVGASDGFYTLLAAHVNPALTVIACEPDVSQVHRQRENYRLNFPAGGPVVEWVPRLVGRAGAMVSLDDLAATRPGPVFVKIDVDGGEVDVLDSGPSVLARADTTLLVEVHSAVLERRVIELLTACGYLPQIIDNAWWRALIPERRSIAVNRWVLAERVDDLRVGAIRARPDRPK